MTFFAILVRVFGIPVVVFHPLIPKEPLWQGRYCAWVGMFEDRRLGNI